MANQNSATLYRESPESLCTLDGLAAHLHSFLASGTYVNDDWDPAGPILIEAKELVARIDGLKIEIYSNEHPPPHFHVVTNGAKASFTLDQCKMLNGNLPSKQQRKVEYWFSNMNAKAALVEVWNRTRPDGCVVGRYVDGGN